MADRIERSPALGNAVWMRRERELGLSREEFSRRLGWTPSPDGGRNRSGWSVSTIVRLEYGRRGIRTAEELNTLAEALGLTAGELEARIGRAESTTRTGDPYGLKSAIDAIHDPAQRDLILGIAADLSRLARELADASRGGTGELGPRDGPDDDER